LNRKLLSFVLVCCLTAIMILPKPGYAITEAEIDRQLEQIQRKEAEAARKRQEAEKQMQLLARQKAQEQKNMQELWRQIEEQGAILNELNRQIEAVTAELRETGKQLEEAEARIVSRDQLLKSRLRLMYTNGFVSYLEVLLGSTSFTDFLDRYEALKAIVSQDKDILEANKRDRDTIAQKKTEIERKLAEVQTLYAESERLKNELVAKEKEKEVLIASIAKQEQELEEFTEEQEQYLRKLAQEKQELYRKKNENKKKAVYTGGKLLWPLPGHYDISSGFGGRTDPINGKKANHTGIDIPAPAGTSIVAAESGTVIIAQYVNGYGNTVVIDHGDIQTWYAHAKKLDVKEGDEVKRGQHIAQVGATGRATGNHLHFEVRKNGTAVNPMSYVK